MSDQKEPTKAAPAEIERRSVSEVALAATPVAIILQPVVGALADKYIGEKPKDPPPQEPKQD